MEPPSTHGHPFKEKRLRCRERERGSQCEGGDRNWRDAATSPGGHWAPAATRSQEEAEVQRLPRIPEREGDPVNTSGVNV